MNRLLRLPTSPGCRRGRRCVGETNLATGESCYILGLLHQYFGEVPQAQARMQAALGIYETKLGPEHHSTKDVAKSLDQLQGVAPVGA